MKIIKENLIPGGAITYLWVKKSSYMWMLKILFDPKKLTIRLDCYLVEKEMNYFTFKY